MKNKKAQSQFSIFTFMITAFLVVVFFGGLIYAMGLINNVMMEAGLSNEVNSGNPMYVNMTRAAQQTFGQVNQSIQALRMVALVMILGLAVIMIVTNALVKIHPLFFFAYILLCLLAVIFAVPISNAYETLLQSGIYDGILTSFSASNFFLLNLPIVVMVVSVLGGIFLFISMIRSSSEGSLN